MPDDPKEVTILALFEVLGRLALLLLGCLYALGFLVTNIHLARYGYFATNILDKRYALSGFWSLVPLLLFFLTEWISAHSNRIFSGADTHKWPTWGRKAASLVIYTILFTTFQRSFAQVLGVPLSWWWLVFVYASGTLYTLAMRKAVAKVRALSATSPLAQTEPPKPASTVQIVQAALAEVEWAWAPIGVSYLVLFTYLLYPHIPASWGGGGAERVQLVVPSEEAEVLASLGIHRLSTQLTAPQLLVATTADDYVLYVDSSRVAFVRRDLVKAITLEGRFKAPQPLRHPFVLPDSIP